MLARGGLSNIALAEFDLVHRDHLAARRLKVVIVQLALQKLSAIAKPVARCAIRGKDDRELGAINHRCIGEDGSSANFHEFTSGD